MNISEKQFSESIKTMQNQVNNTLWKNAAPVKTIDNSQE